MVSLCNVGTKDFGELWEIIYLKIWTHFFIRQTKLFWINLKHYSQTCSNIQLCKTTTRLRWPMLSLPKQIPLQSLLCKTSLTERNKRLNLWSPLIDWGNSWLLLIESLKMTCARSYVWFLNFLDCFSWHVLPELKK